MSQLFIRYHLPPFLWALLIFAVSSIPSRELPHIEVFGIDKLAHFIIYAVLCWLIFRSLSSRSDRTLSPGRIILFSVVLTLLYGASDELHQILVPGREPSVYDWAADAAGALFAVIIAARLRKNPH